MPVGTSRPIEIMDAWMLALKKGEPKAARSFTNDDRHETFKGKKLQAKSNWTSRLLYLIGFLKSAIKVFSKNG